MILNVPTGFLRQLPVCTRFMSATHGCPATRRAEGALIHSDSEDSEVDTAGLGAWGPQADSEEEGDAEPALWRPTLVAASRSHAHTEWQVR